MRTKEKETTLFFFLFSRPFFLHFLVFLIIIFFLF